MLFRPSVYPDLEDEPEPAASAAAAGRSFIGGGFCGHAPLLQSARRSEAKLARWLRDICVSDYVVLLVWVSPFAEIPKDVQSAVQLTKELDAEGLDSANAH